MMFTNKNVYLIVFLLFANANSILTDHRPVTVSSWYNSASDPMCQPNRCDASQAVDNDFSTITHTRNSGVEWINV